MTEQGTDQPEVRPDAHRGDAAGERQVEVERTIEASEARLEEFAEADDELDSTDSDSMPEPESESESEARAAATESDDTESESMTEPDPEPQPEPEDDPAPEPVVESDEGPGDDGDAEDESAATVETDEEKQRREEEFAREHDPAQHDVAAGDEFRQAGDWTAGDEGAIQVQDAEGNVDFREVSAEELQPTGDSTEGGGEDSESSLEDVRDGGYGVGSAAVIDGGVIPLGHHVKAWHDTMTHVLPGEAGYDGGNPDVWFLDQEAAERAGFRHAHGAG